MTGLKTTAVVVGVLVAFLGGFLILSGVDDLTSSSRDSDGYYTTDPATFDRASAAIVVRDIEIVQGRFRQHTADSPGLLSGDLDVRIQGVTSGPGALFMGVATTVVVDAYLDGIAHDEITGLDLDRATIGDVEYTTHEGTGTLDAPGVEAFWATSVEGTGLQTLDWTVEPGEWTAVIMNADASSGVTAELDFGATASNLAAVAWTKITIGLIALVGGGLVAFLGLRHPHRGSVPGVVDLRDEESAQQTESLQQGTAPRS